MRTQFWVAETRSTMSRASSKPRRKKVDARIRTLIENGVKGNHRSFFVVVGDRGRDQVPNLHYVLNKASAKRRASRS